MAALRGCYLPVDAGPYARELRLRGYDFVVRCYADDPARCLDLAEVERLTAAGLRVGACWTGGAGRLTRRQGLLDGAQVLALARAAGQPPGSTIYVGGAGAQPEEPFAAWLRGVRTALGGPAGYRLGVRGDAGRGARMRDRGLADCIWSEATTLPHSGRPHLVQWPGAPSELRAAGRAVVPLLARAAHEPGLFGRPAARRGRVPDRRA